MTWEQVGINNRLTAISASFSQSTVLRESILMLPHLWYKVVLILLWFMLLKKEIILVFYLFWKMGVVNIIRKHLVRRQI